MMFSGGKDAIAAAHQLRQTHKGPITWVYLYFVDGLEVIEPTLRHYERRWKIKIHRRPCHDALSLQAELRGDRKTHYKYGDVERRTREEFGVEWICDGMKKADSMARRGMLKACTPDGVDDRLKKYHPLIDWSEKKVHAYCRLHKLPLPATYSMGLKNSVWVPDANLLIWMKGAFPGDYKKIIDTFPQCGDAVFKKLGTI